MKKQLTQFLTLFLILTIEFSFAQDIWQPTKGPNGLNVADFAITTDNVLVISAINSGVYFSIDNGVSWQKRSIGLYHTNSYATSIEAGPDGILYALIDDELYRMEKGTDEWDKTIYKFQNATLAANQNGTLFVISDFIDIVILISKDKGNTFKSILRNSNFSLLDAYSFNGNNNNFLMVYESGGDEVIYRLTDDGSEFKKIYSLNVGFPQLCWHPAGFLFIIDPFEGLIRMDSLGNNVRKINSKAAQANLLAVKPNGNLVSYTYDGDYESSDLGNNWTIKNSEIYKRTQLFDKIFFANNDIYVFSTNCVDGLSKTSDEGLSWNSFDSQFANTSFNEMFVDKSGRLFANTCYASNYVYSDDKGEHWTKLNLPDTTESFSELMATSTGNLFIRSYDKLYKSTDKGNSWSQTSILNETMFDLLAGDHDKTIYAYGAGKDFITTDGGSTWLEIQNSQLNVNQISVHPDGAIFAVSRDFFGAIYYSTDQGKNWTQSPLQLESIDAFHITKDGTIYLSGYSPSSNDYGTFVSKDKLATWQLVNTNTYNNIVSDNDGALYGAEYFGLCKKSTDGGKTWRPYVSGLPAEGNGRAIVIDKDQYLFMSLEYDVVFRTVDPVTKTVGIANWNQGKAVSVYPNPVSDKIDVFFFDELDVKGSRWEFLDVNGRIIKSGIVKTQKLTIDVQDIPQGMFLLRFSNLKIPVQKIIIQH